MLQPRDVLFGEGKVDAQALALGQEDRPVGAELIVGRSQAGEHQRRRGHQQDQERGKHRAAEHEAREAAVHVLSLFRLKSASALRGNDLSALTRHCKLSLQRSWGICGAGRGFATRELTASVTLGATK